MGLWEKRVILTVEAERGTLSTAENRAGLTRTCNFAEFLRARGEFHSRDLKDGMAGDL